MPVGPLTPPSAPAAGRRAVPGATTPAHPALGGDVPEWRRPLPRENGSGGARCRPRSARPVVSDANHPLAHVSRQEPGP